MSHKMDIYKRAFDLKKVLPKEKQIKLEELFPKDEEKERMNQIVKGLSKEDEFILISKLLGNCEFITKIDGSPYVNPEKYIAPDLIAAYILDLYDEGKVGRLFIEVKRVYGQTWKISRKDFQKRVNFSRLFGLPLQFAINFNLGGTDVWCMVPANYVEKNGLKVKILDLKENQFDLLTGNIMVNVKKGIIETKIYDSSNKIRKGVYHPKYGQLVKVVYELNKKKVSINPIKRPWELILRHCRGKEKIVKEGTIIKVIKKFSESEMIQLYQLLLWTIKILLRNPDLDFGKYLIRLINNEVKVFPTAQFFKYFLYDLRKEGFVVFARMLPGSVFDNINKKGTT